MKMVWTHIGGRRVVPLQFHWNVYTAWPLFNRMAPCGLCERGSWGGHRQAELELPQSPKWLKKKKRLYSEGTVLKCISLLERTIIPSHFHPLWESKISSFSTSVPRFNTQVPFPGKFSSLFREQFLAAPAGGEASLSTYSISKPWGDHSDWQPRAHPCPLHLLTWSLESLFMWGHSPSSLTAGSCVLQAVVDGFLCYSWIRTLDTLCCPHICQHDGM